MKRVVTILSLCLAMSIVSESLADDAPAAPAIDAATVRGAIEKSLPLLKAAAVGHRENRSCFACHNQAFAVMAWASARERGFTIDDEELQKQLAHIAKFLDRNRDNYREGKGQGGQVDMAGYALVALAAGGWKPDDTTAAVTDYLLLRDNDRDHWVNVSVRPPSEASPFTATYVGLRGLTDFGSTEQREKIARRREQVRGWLVGATANDHEDRVFRLWGLALAEADPEHIAAARRELEQRQRPDGGWAQLDQGEPASATTSDPYATATALVALHQAGGLATSSAEYHRGLKYLLDAQQPDGSWRVTSRSKPFQAYFESGYPHGKDQFISCAAGGWATLAFLQVLPKQK